jgi:transposase
MSSTILEWEKFYPKEMNIDEIIQAENEIYFKMSVHSKKCRCIKCGIKSTHRHGTYKRKLQDLPILGKSTYLIVKAYEYQCDNTECDATTFVESIDGFLNYYSRMSKGYTFMVK